MTSCIAGKKIRAMGPGLLELFPFVVLAILMAMAGGISEQKFTSWSSYYSCFIEIPVFNANSVDPDQMLHFVASDLSLHYLTVILLGFSD